MLVELPVVEQRYLALRRVPYQSRLVGLRLVGDTVQITVKNHWSEPTARQDKSKEFGALLRRTARREAVTQT
jgi:hypothetical protein